MDTKKEIQKSAFEFSSIPSVAETRNLTAHLDPGSIVNELGCGPEPIGLRSQFKVLE